MTYLLAVIGGGLLFALFALVRPDDRKVGCTGHCDSCPRDGACESNEATGVRR